MPATAVQQKTMAEPVVLRAPLFAELIAALDEDQRHVLLDLGPARAGLIERLGLLRCRLDILDLPQHIQPLNRLEADQDAESMVKMLRDCLPRSEPEPVQIVFCWDLLDYLPLAVTSRLFGLLQERLAPGARLHALVEYSSRQMPAAPRQIGPNLDGELLIDAGSGVEISAPRHSLGTLARYLPGFQSERSMLLGNGMQEYLFRFCGSV